MREVLTHASQVRASSEDATDVASWTPHDDARVWYIASHANNTLLGVFTLIPENQICYQIHAAILPHAWGARSTEALRGALAFAFRETPARRVTASIPAYNRLAIALARRAGMTQFGLNPASFMKHGEMHDQILIGISTPCHHS